MEVSLTPVPVRLSLLYFSLLALAACSGKGQQAPPQMPPPEVGVLTMQPQNSPLTKDLVGRLSAYRSADVRARVAGVLLKRTYDEGSEVEEGQILFKIDPAPLKATVDANLGALAQAQATYTNNKIAAQRARELVPKGYISKSDLDNAEAAERTAAAAVQAAKANVQSARINLGYADVRSPIRGRSGQQQVTEGALVGNGEATLLTTVDQIDPLYVNFTIGVTDLEQMRQAQSTGHVTLSDPDKSTVQVTLPDGSPYPERGVLDFSDIMVNPATGSVNLRASLPNPTHRLLPGTYVTLKAELGEQRNVFFVPQLAVQRDTAGAFVLVVGPDNKVDRRNITTSDMRNGNWVVTAGIQDGDQVIASGLQKAKEGAPVKATPWRPPSDKHAAAAPTTPGAAATQP